MNHLRAGFLDELVKTGAPRVIASRLTPESSNVRGYSYDPDAQALTVTYKSGGTYRYDGVPPGVAKSLARNKSTGKTLNRLVKGPGYTYEKVGARMPVRALGRELFDRAMDTLVAKEANGDMLEYLQQNPDKLRAKMERERRKAQRKQHQKHAAVGWASKVLKRLFTPDRPRRMVTEIGDLDEALLAAARSRLKKTPGGRLRRESRGFAEKLGAPAIEEYFATFHKRAGVAKKQITFNGLRLKIEYEPGDIRTGKSRDGKTWERKMHAFYGYIPGTKGKAADGDAIDIYMAHEPAETAPVFEIRQEKKDGGYDESKFMLGWETAARAKAAYLQHMPEWAFGSIEEVAPSVPDFAEKIDMTPKMSKAASPGLAAGVMAQQPKSTLPPISTRLKVHAVRAADARGENKSPSFAAGRAAGAAFAGAAGGSGGAPKPPAPPKPIAMAKTSSPFVTGFADELTKEAGLKDVIRRVVIGRPSAPPKLGFFARRRVARALGVAPKDVDRVLAQREQRGRLARRGAMVGAAATGGLVGTHLSSS